MANRTSTAPGHDQVALRDHGRFWMVVTAVELTIASAAVIADVFLPTVVILALATISLLYRRAGPASLGFLRTGHPARMALHVLALVVAWTLLQIGLVMPILEHLTGERQDVSAFDDIQGNLGILLVFLALSWTLAAVGEEAAYRGFIQTRAIALLGDSAVGLVAAVAFSAVLFGLAHTEQGLIGVVVTFLDAIFFSVLRIRYRTLWASVLAHGFNNTIGLTAFFLVGPIHGLW